MKTLLKRLFRRLHRYASLAYVSFGSGKECPICGWTGHRFMKQEYPYKPAPSFICPRCRSSERHRFAFLALKEEVPKYSQKILHFAPEKCIEPWLRNLAKDYLSVDICAPNAMAHMDIVDLKLDDETFTLIWCSHVLEHIDDDRTAISELYRVLKPSGKAVVMVPVYGSSTYENPGVKTPEERLKHFKQQDHVRLYGRDIVNRLEDIGFDVEVISLLDFPEDQISRNQLDYPSTREIFLASKAR